jgi:hypothetical protein
MTIQVLFPNSSIPWIDFILIEFEHVCVTFSCSMAWFGHNNCFESHLREFIRKLFPLDDKGGTDRHFRILSLIVEVNVLLALPPVPRSKTSVARTRCPSYRGPNDLESIGGSEDKIRWRQIGGWLTPLIF